MHVDVIGHANARPGQCHARAACRNRDRSGKAKRVDALLRDRGDRQGPARVHVAILDGCQHPNRAVRVNARDLVQHDRHPQRGTNPGAAHANRSRDRDDSSIDRAFVARSHCNRTEGHNIAGADSRGGRGTNIVLADGTRTRDRDAGLTQCNRHRRRRRRRIDRRGRYLQQGSVNFQCEGAPRSVDQNPARIIAQFAQPDGPCTDCIGNSLANRQVGVQQIDNLGQNRVIAGLVGAVGDHLTVHAHHAGFRGVIQAIRRKRRLVHGEIGRRGDGCGYRQIAGQINQIHPLNQRGHCVFHIVQRNCHTNRDCCSTLSDGRCRRRGQDHAVDQRSVMRENRQIFALNQRRIGDARNRPAKDLVLGNRSGRRE